jgi:hypothetical protein
MKAKAAEDPVVAETELLQFATAYVGGGNARNPLAARYTPIFRASRRS